MNPFADASMPLFVPRSPTAAPESPPSRPSSSLSGLPRFETSTTRLAKESRAGSVIVGIGCRRGVAETDIEQALAAAFELAGLSGPETPAQWRRVRLATVDRKRDEAGLLAFARRRDVPIAFFSAEALAAFVPPTPPGATAPAAPDGNAVFRHVGIASVCDAAAWRACPHGTPHLHKTRLFGMTIAIVIEPSGD